MWLSAWWFSSVAFMHWFSGSSVNTCMGFCFHHGLWSPVFLSTCKFVTGACKLNAKYIKSWIYIFCDLVRMVSTLWSATHTIKQYIVKCLPYYLVKAYYTSDKWKEKKLHNNNNEWGFAGTSDYQLKLSNVGSPDQTIGSLFIQFRASVRTWKFIDIFI